MRKITSLIFLLLCFLLTVFVIFLFFNIFTVKVEAATGSPEIIINEIMYNPSGNDDNYEWLEIVNVSTSTDYLIDSAWRFNDGGNHQLSVVRGDETITAGEFAVLAEDGEIFLQAYPDFAGTLIDTAMSLNNTEDVLTLSVNAGQSFFATTTYQSAWGAGDNNQSLERINLTDSWRESLVIGGTPGQINSAAPANSPLRVAIIGPTGGQVGQVLEFSASTTEPDGEELLFEWNFGDNSTSSAETVNQVFTQAGNYFISLEVFDGAFTASSSLNLIIEELPPEEEEETTEITEVYSNQIIINEILADPVGSDNEDEFIELHNRDNQPVDLNGWLMSDATARNYRINRTDFTSTVIQPFSYFVVYRGQSGIALNNTGDKVELFQPDGHLLDTVDYSKTGAGWSYAKSGGGWFLTAEITPGQSNVIKTQTGGPEPPPPSNCPAVVKVEEEKEAATDFKLEDFQALRINEFLPDPEGSDEFEWAEIFNASSSALNLSGLRLDDEDGGSRPYVFPGTTIKAFDYLVITREESKIALNNSGDSLRLLSPDGEIIWQLDYDKAPVGQSYNYSELDGEWFWSKTPTAGGQNVSLAGESGDLSLSAEKEDYPFYPLEEIKDLPKGEPVKTVGLVGIPPLSLGNKITYLVSQEQASIGLQIYSSSHDFLQLKMGDLIEVRGKVSEIQGEKRLNLVKDTSIVNLGPGNIPEPELIVMEDLTDDVIGGLIKVSGELVDQKGNDYYLDDGTAELRIYLKISTGLAKPKIEEGYFMETVGILSLTKSGYRLLPRLAEDIKTGEIRGATEEIDLTNEEIIMEASGQDKKLLKYLVVIISSLLAIVLALIIKFKMKTGKNLRNFQ